MKRYEVTFIKKSKWKTVVEARDKRQAEAMVLAEVNDWSEEEEVLELEVFDAKEQSK